MPNISRGKGNQTIKFGHLIEHNKINIINHAENKAGTSSKSFSFF